jgi:hypothetical protein
MSQPDNSAEWRNWLPDWLSPDMVLPAQNHAEPNNVSQGSQEPPQEQPAAAREETQQKEWIKQNPILIPVKPNGDRITKRRLRGIHLFVSLLSDP